MDIKPTPTGRIVVDFLKKKFPAYVDTGLNLVDATECARGHVVALEKGRSGQRYILGGENLTLKQILDKLAAITGLAVAEGKSAIRDGAGDRRGRRNGDRMDSRTRAASDDRRGAHGAEERCSFLPRRQSANSAGRSCRSMERFGGRWRGFGRRVMPEVAIVAALERELRPLVREWKVAEREHAGRRFRFFESDRAVVVCGGIGPEAARRATEAVITFVPAGARRIGGLCRRLDEGIASGRNIRSSLRRRLQGRQQERKPGPAMEC